MSENMDYIALIAAITQLLVAVATLMKLIQTHNTFNSKMDEAMRVAKAGAAAQATLDEKAAQRVREAESALSVQQRDDTTIR
jgi:hypothetical protein